MRGSMRILVFLILPGIAFAPMIAQAHAIIVCETFPDRGLLNLLRTLPPCPALPSSQLAVPLLVAAITAVAAWNVLVTAAPRRSPRR
jgi:hypothetical protein